MVQLVKKRKKEAAEKAQVEQIGKEVGKHTGGIEQGSNKGVRSPSPKTEEEDINHHNMDPQDIFTCIKRPRELEKGGSRKKSKATKTLLEPITLREGDLYDISDIVRDVTTEALQQFEK